MNMKVTQMKKSLCQSKVTPLSPKITKTSLVHKMTPMTKFKEFGGPIFSSMENKKEEW